MAKTTPAKSTGQKSTIQKIEVEVSGGIDRAAINIDAVPIPLRPTNEGFAGSKTVTLDPPTIKAVWTVKGGLNADFDFEVTINGVTQPIKGFLKKGETIKSDERDWTFEDFELDKLDTD
jgi:hypothetical protein